MLLFGHMGLSLGAGKLLSRINKKTLYLPLVIGAIFPDIDKLISIIFGLGGRTFFHTMIFAMAVTVAGFLLRKKIVTSFALGVWLHLLLDFMWLEPETLFWPLLGQFNARRFDLSISVTSLYLNPIVIIAEIIGFAIFMHHVWRNKLYKSMTRKK